MTARLKTKPVIFLAICLGLTAIVFAAQAFFSPQESESELIGDYVVHFKETTYTDPDYGFSLGIPKDFNLSTTSENEGEETIVAEHPTLDLGMEIFVQPFDEEELPAADEIRKLNPSLVVKAPINNELEDGTPTLRFESEDPAIGATRQIWFTHDGNLFQVIMYSKNIEWLDAWAREFPSDWTFDESEANSSS